MLQTKTPDVEKGSTGFEERLFKKLAEMEERLKKIEAKLTTPLIK